MKVIVPNQLDRINVDTTVQEKHVCFPTNSRLYHRARESLVKAAAKAGLSLRQSYTRCGKKLLRHAQAHVASPHGGPGRAVDGDMGIPAEILNILNGLKVTFSGSTK